MTYISDLISLFGSIYHLLLEVPVLGVGILVGAFVYRFLLKKYPSLLQTLVTDVEAAGKTILTKASTSSTATNTATAATGTSSSSTTQS